MSICRCATVLITRWRVVWCSWGSRVSRGRCTMITQTNWVPTHPLRTLQTPVVVAAAAPKDLVSLSGAAAANSKGRTAAAVAGGVLGGAALGVAGAYAGTEAGLLIGLLLPADSLTSLLAHRLNGG